MVPKSARPATEIRRSVRRTFRILLVPIGPRLARDSEQQADLEYAQGGRRLGTGSGDRTHTFLAELRVLGRYGTTDTKRQGATGRTARRRPINSRLIVASNFRPMGPHWPARQSAALSAAFSSLDCGSVITWSKNASECSYLDCVPLGMRCSLNHLSRMPRAFSLLVDDKARQVRARYRRDSVRWALKERHASFRISTGSTDGLELDIDFEVLTVSADKRPSKAGEQAAVRSEHLE